MDLNSRMCFSENSHGGNFREERETVLEGFLFCLGVRAQQQMAFAASQTVPAAQVNFLRPVIFLALFLFSENAFPLAT